MNSQALEAALAYRQHSPLFARLANEYLSSGQIEHAKELCVSGLERFPRYTTGHLVLAKCFAAEESYSSAIEQLRRVMELVPDSAVVHDLLTRWNELALRPPQPIVDIPEPESAPEPVQEVVPAEEASVRQDEARPQVLILKEARPPLPRIEEVSQLPASATGEPTQEVLKPLEVVPSAIAATTVLGRDTRLSSKTQSFQPGVRPSDVLDRESGRIVTRTLAEIYAMQNAYGEAILTYELLKRKRPDQIGEIDRRIRELEAKRQTK